MLSDILAICLDITTQTHYFIDGTYFFSRRSLSRVHAEHLGDESLGFKGHGLRHMEESSGDLGEEFSLILAFERIGST